MPKLYVIGTPIGNLEDITYRAVRILKEVNFLIVEDKRRTVILLNKYDIGNKKMISINERISDKKLKKVVDEIKKNEKSALVSDAGMPIISDPGRVIVDKCWEEGIEVDVVPGPSAVVSAVAVSGFSGSKFCFLGFLPKGKKRRRILKEKLKSKETVVFFESPHRLKDTLKDILNTIGDLELFIAREMTKLHQEFFRGRVSEALEKFKEEIKGEITIVIGNRGGE